MTNYSIEIEKHITDSKLGKFTSRAFVRTQELSEQGKFYACMVYDTSGLHQGEQPMFLPNAAGFDCLSLSNDQKKQIKTALGEFWKSDSRLYHLELPALTPGDNDQSFFGGNAGAKVLINGNHEIKALNNANPS